jgi:hypothetical protein
MHIQNTEGNKSGLNSDIITIIALAIIVYILQNILHEYVGHGGACILLGGDPISFSTAYFDCDSTNVSDAGRRIIASAGSIINILAGLVGWILLKRLKGRSNTVRYFLWLFMTVNLLTGTGYPLFSGVIGVGDWVVVIKGIEPFWIWRTMIILLGLILYAISIWISLTDMNSFIGAKEPDRYKQAFILSFVPYISGSFASTLGAFLNPLSIVFVFTSAASSFGGTSALTWMTQLLKSNLFKKIPTHPLFVKRNWYIICLSIIVLIMHIFLIGSGVQL